MCDVWKCEMARERKTKKLNSIQILLQIVRRMFMKRHGEACKLAVSFGAEGSRQPGVMIMADGRTDGRGTPSSLLFLACVITQNTPTSSSQAATRRDPALFAHKTLNGRLKKI
jgi:hypothetical protein